MGRTLVKLALGFVVAAAGIPLGAAGAAGPAPEPASGATDWKQISTDGDSHGCAVKTTGQAFCWGNDGAGRLGDDATIAEQHTPVEVADGATDWKRISAGGSHTCAMKTSKRLFCWGSDGNGRLGDDATIAEQHTPVEVAGGATNWKQVSAGFDHTCALKTSGRLFCWGNDGSGRLGDDATIAEQHTPIEVAGGATNWAQVDAGYEHTCARKTTGRLFCWGDDSNGQLGDDETPADQPTPVEVAGGAKNWKQVDGGRFHTCALKTSKRAFCWGRDVSGQLGDNATLASQPTPVEVAGGTKDWKQVTAGNAHTCAVKTSRLALCWGSDGSGQLGDNATLASQPTPIDVAGAATDWKRVTTGFASTCAVKTSRRAFCWGDDLNGRLGDNATIAFQPTPVEVAG